MIIKKQFLLLFMVLSGMYFQIQAQNCTNCSGTTNTGTNSSAIGTNTSATAHSAFASGYASTASGNYSVAMGYNASASGLYSTAIGKNAQAANTGFAFGRDITANALNSMAIGIGRTSSNILTNSISKSIMFGAYSSTPSIILRQNSTEDIPALVGIGTTNPQQMLHIEGNTLISGNGKGLLFATSSSTTNGNFGIRYMGEGLSFFVPNTTMPLMYIKDNGNVGIGTILPTVKFEVNGSSKATNITATSSLQSSTLTVTGLSQLASLNVTGAIQTNTLSTTGLVRSNSLNVTGAIQSGSLDVTGSVTFRGLSGSTSRAIVVNASGVVNTVSYATFHDNMGNHTAMQNINLNGRLLVNGTSSTSGIFISTAGNVGIGTSNPTQKLAVNGTIRSKEVVVEVAN